MGTHRGQDHSIFGLIAIFGLGRSQASKHHKHRVPFLMTSAPSALLSFLYIMTDTLDS